MHVAYLVNQYPAVSHTFIKREIHALERLGVQVSRFALRGWDATLVDDSDLAERQRTRYLLQNAASNLAISVLRRLVAQPRKFASAAALAVRMARHSDKSLLRHLIYLAEACILREWLAECGATHLHAHFASNPADVVTLVHALGGPPCSFTAHGSDIMDRPAQTNLPLKLANASFVAAVCSFGRNQIYRWVPYELWRKVAVVRCGLEPGYASTSKPTPVRAEPVEARTPLVLSLSKDRAEPVEARTPLVLSLSKDRAEPVEAGVVQDGPFDKLRANGDKTKFDLSTSTSTVGHDLVCIGRLSKEKGQSLLIEALAHLKEQGQRVSVRLIGDGPMRQELERLIAQHQLSGQVQFAGWMDSSAIENELTQCRALVVPSLSEGLPVVIMEAMAHRRPVIAPFLSGIPELVRAGQTGWLYPAGDKDALAQAIQSCVNADDAELTRLGNQAHTQVWAAHNVDIEVTKLARLMGWQDSVQPPPRP